MLHELFHTQVGIGALIALVATIGSGIVVTILVFTRVLRAEKSEDES